MFQMNCNGDFRGTVPVILLGTVPIDFLMPQFAAILCWSSVARHGCVNWRLTKRKDLSSAEMERTFSLLADAKSAMR